MSNTNIDNTTRDALINKFTNLAEKIALSRSRSTPPSVSYDDLKTSAYMGLLDAATKFNYEKSNANNKDKAFIQYASLRISGQISDYLRSCYWLGTRKNPISVLFFDQMGDGSYRDNDSSCSGSSGPGNILHKAVRNDKDDHHRIQRREFFDEVLKSLPHDVKQVFELYYIDGYTMKEIGTKVDFCESRISQMLSQYKKLLRKNLMGKKDELFEDYSN